MSTAILSKGEPTLYSCIGPLALVLGPLTAAQVVHFLHQLSTSHRLGTGPSKISNFRQRLVDSKMSTRTPSVCL